MHTVVRATSGWSAPKPVSQRTSGETPPVILSTEGAIHVAALISAALAKTMIDNGRDIREGAVGRSALGVAGQVRLALKGGAAAALKHRPTKGAGWAGPWRARQ